ncbi:MAG: hypothetical protein D6694_05975, partial [Gammaproteobacteria bacterium]
LSVQWGTQSPLRVIYLFQGRERLYGLKILLGLFFYAPQMFGDVGVYSISLINLLNFVFTPFCLILFFSISYSYSDIKFAEDIFQTCLKISKSSFL